MYVEPPPKRLALPAISAQLSSVFWTPNQAFVNELTAFLQEKRVLEVFAGNGYLAGLLAREGIDIKATTRFSGHDGHQRGIYHDVEDLDAVHAVHKHGSDRDVLLMCWPTVTMAAVRAAALWGAERDIVFIGERTDYSLGHLGGCGTDELFAMTRFTRRFETYRGNLIEGAWVARFQAS